MRNRIVCTGKLVVLVGVVVALAAAVGCAVPLHTSSSPPSDSGVKGMVTLGPISPVEQVGGPPNERPYAATIDVLAKGTTTVVVTTHSVADGRFTVRLAPAGVGRHAACGAHRCARGGAQLHRRDDRLRQRHPLAFRFHS
jgi:hypothetical protein